MPVPYYHCSPTPGLTALEPRRPETFDKPPAVYMTTLLAMALMYGARCFEYTYGYTADGQIYFEEYFPDALSVLYKGKSASLYVCSPQQVKITQIPHECISEEPVPVISETRIPDVYEELLRQERLGALRIRRYEQLTAKDLARIRQAEKEEILKRGLLVKGGPMAEYMRLHYPESWALARLRFFAGDRRKRRKKSAGDDNFSTCFYTKCT